MTRSRSKSKHSSPAKSFVVERFNFNEAVNVLETARETFDDINRDEFIPQDFVSSATAKEQEKKNIKKQFEKKKLPEKVQIDLTNEQIIMPAIVEEKPEEETLFNPSFFGDGDEDERMRRWVRKLMIYRQKLSEQTMDITEEIK